MTMTATDPGMTATVLQKMRRKRQMSLAVPAAIIAYLVYAAISFDIASLVQRARFDNAAILLSDFWSHKTHVTRDNRSGDVTVAIEGEGKATYPEGMLPDWVSIANGVTTIDLGDGHIVTYDDAGARYVVPGYGLLAIRSEGGHGGGPLQLFPVEGGNLQIRARVGAVVLYPRQPVLRQVLYGTGFAGHGG